MSSQGSRSRSSSRAGRSRSPSPKRESRSNKLFVTNLDANVKIMLTSGRFKKNGVITARIIFKIW